jgi:hypothetical protein
MPFTDEEQCMEEKSKLKTFILIAGVGLFAISLFNICFCTDNGCRTSFEAFLIGWLGMLTGGASLTWLANPLLVVCWILMAKNKKTAWPFGLLSTLVSISFLKFQVIIENEAGHYNPITKIGSGYWLWLSSSLATFLGSLIIRILRFKKQGS